MDTLITRLSPSRRSSSTRRRRSETADYYESQQNSAEAKKIYAEIAKDNPSSEAASLAQRKSAALK